MSWGPGLGLKNSCEEPGLSLEGDLREGVLGAKKSSDSDSEEVNLRGVGSGKTRGLGFRPLPWFLDGGQSGGAR